MGAHEFIATLPGSYHHRLSRTGVMVTRHARAWGPYWMAPSVMPSTMRR